MADTLWARKSDRKGLDQNLRRQEKGTDENRTRTEGGDEAGTTWQPLPSSSAIADAQTHQLRQTVRPGTCCPRETHSKRKDTGGRQANGGERHPTSAETEGSGESYVIVRRDNLGTKKVSRGQTGTDGRRVMVKRPILQGDTTRLDVCERPPAAGERRRSCREKARRHGRGSRRVPQTEKRRGRS